MKTASVALNTALKQSLAIHALPRLIAEWNQNRYAGIFQVDNANPEATHGYDQVNFPIKSIVEPNRPTRGIAKGRVSEDTVPVVPRPPFTPGAAAQGRVVEGYADLADSSRYYLADDTDLYKYWCSPVPTTTTIGGGKYGFAEPVEPRVIYTTTPWTNKIVVTFESSSSVPNDYDIQVTTDGSIWTTIASDIVPDSKGQVTLYRQAGGTWSSSVYRENPVQIKGLKIVVTAMNAPDAFFNLIELSARLENDLTAFVMDYSSEFTLSEPSFVAPLGKASSNTAEITLSNVDGRFNNDNAASLYYGIIDKNVKMTLDLVYDTTAYGGSSSEAVRQLTMYVDDWAGQGEASVAVTLKDSSKFMQEIKPLPVFYEEMTLGEIVWRLCDSIGFIDYKYDRFDTDPATLVPYFWANGESTVWEIFSNLAESTQSAIYFDEYNILQIQTRNSAYDLAKPVVWELDAVQNGSKMADIIELNETYNFEANSVNVKYKTTKISDDANGFPQMEIVWQPEDTVVLRSSALVENLTSIGMVMRVDPKDANVWPYEGVVQVEGEFIRYKDKGYYYYNSAGVQTHTYITSLDDKNRVDKSLSNPDLAWKNSFSGYFKIIKRGEWGTTAAAHIGPTNEYASRFFKLGTSTPSTPWIGGTSFLREDSTLRLATTKDFSLDHVYTATRGIYTDAAPTHIGTRLRIDEHGNHFTAGLVINNAPGELGYYINLTRTYACDMQGVRKYHHELSFFVRYSNGTIRRLGPDGGKGVRMAIEKDTWYDLDVYFGGAPSAPHVVRIMVNGRVMMTVNIVSTEIVPPSGRNGVTVNGNSGARFEYFYAITGGEELVDDSEGFFDKVTGGFMGGQWDRDWVYGWRTNYKIVNKKRVAFQQRYNTRFFAEFGPIVHEVREYNVKFDKYPSVYSELYMSNDYQVICAEYNGDPFGSKFYLANTARVNAIVNGEDTTTFGADNPVEQKMFIYGRLVFQEDEKSAIVKNEDAIRRRGEVTLEVMSDWIQSEAAAKSMGEWITRHWSGGNDELIVDVFGNPLLQLGDMVSVNYPAKDMTKTTHKYFIVAISTNFSEGLVTKLTLRRAKV